VLETLFQFLYMSVLPAQAKKEVEVLVGHFIEIGSAFLHVFLQLLDMLLRRSQPMVDDGQLVFKLSIIII
jgi:hypothetical protein